MALECWGHPAETGLEAAGGDMKRFVFTKIKVYFYQYHQQMGEFHLSWKCKLLVDIQKVLFQKYMFLFFVTSLYLGSRKCKKNKVPFVHRELGAPPTGPRQGDSALLHLHVGVPTIKKVLVVRAAAYNSEIVFQVEALVSPERYRGM